MRKLTRYATRDNKRGRPPERYPAFKKLGAIRLGNRQRITRRG
jgi:hypothetical protein